MTAPTDQRAVVVDWVAEVALAAEAGHPVRVAVDGITGVGKTTFADEVAAAVDRRGGRSTRVSMDGFHHPRAIRHRQGRESADGYYEDAYDLTALRRGLLDPLGPSGDRRCRTATIDLATDQPAGDRLRVIDSDVVVVDGSFLQKPELAGAWDLTVYLDAPFADARVRGVARDAPLLGSRGKAERLFRTRYHAAQQRYLAEVDPRGRADLVIDHADVTAPVVRSDRRVGPNPVQLEVVAARAFFAPRAATWNERFEHDLPAFRRAVTELGIRRGQRVLDLGCGAGRAFADLRAATGPTGSVVGLDVTRAMLAAAPPGLADLVEGDAARLPFPDHAIDRIFAAGLLLHLGDPIAGLVELARVAAPKARLALFHPVGRERLAAKHHRELRPDELLAGPQLAVTLAATGWRLTALDDGADRYLALAGIS
jgi:uridine kinase